MFNTLNDALKGQVTMAGRGITFVSGESEREFCSYAELYELAINALNQLQRNGVRAGNEVILQLDNQREFLIVFWACLFGGIIPVPLSVGNTEEHISKAARVATVLSHPYIVADPLQLEKLDAQVHRFENTAYRPISVSDLMNPTEHRSDILGAILPDDVAFIQFSSGTTGDPKGVKLTHRNLLANVRDLEERLGAGPQDTFLSWMPLTHDLGMIMFHLVPLVCGVNQYLMPTWLFIRRPVLWLQTACQFGATMLASPNFGLKYFLSAYHKAAAKRAFEWDLSGIRAIVNGAEPIDVGVCRQFLDEMGRFGLKENTMKMGYGMAEVCVAACIQMQDEAFTTYYVRRDGLNVGDHAVVVPGDDQENVLALAGTGTPLSHCQVRICDDLDSPLQEGTVGHIQIIGDNVTAGYYNNKEATDRLFTSDGWLHTGDLGFLVGHHLVVTGRTKDIIFINGSNYFPHDIERIAEEGTDLKIKRMVACGIYNESTGTEEAALFILYRDNLEAFGQFSEQIRRHVNRVTGLHISIILPVSKIYQTTSGKLQRYKYATKYKEGAYREIEAKLDDIQKQQEKEAGGLQRKPEGEIEQSLFRIWCDILGKERFDLEDSFFEIGGTSMLLVQMFERVDQRYPGVITLTDIFASPSVAQLSRLLSGSHPSEQKKLHLATVQLAETYFEPTVSGAENHYRMMFQGSKRNRFRSCCSQLGITEEAVCLALFANTLYEQSTDSKVAIHTMIDGPGWVVPFYADFAAIDTIEELLDLANRKKSLGEAEVYHIGDLAKGATRPESGHARCFLVKKGLISPTENVQGLFDMILEWEDVADSAVITFRYNAVRMNSSLIRELFQGFADAVEALISMDMISTGPVPG